MLKLDKDWFSILSDLLVNFSAGILTAVLIETQIATLNLLELTFRLLIVILTLILAKEFRTR